MSWLARGIVRWWPAWLVLWAAAAVGLHALAPPWQDVTTESEMSQLPATMPTRRATRLYDSAFPNERSDSNLVIILERPDAMLGWRDFLFLVDDLTPLLEEVADRRGGVVQPSDLRLLTDIARAWLRDDFSSDGQPNLADAFAKLADSATWEEPLAGTNLARPSRGVPGGDPFPKTSPADSSHGERPPRIVSIVAPHNSIEAPLLISADRHAMLVVVKLSSGFLSSANHPLIAEVENGLRELEFTGKVPPGLNCFITGSAVVGRDVVQAVSRSTQAVQRWTIVLVLLLLMVVFRAPLVALIPLLTMFVAVETALDLIAILAKYGYLVVFDGLEIYMTVLVYGASVDYSLFLIERYREELSAGCDVKESARTAIRSVGAAVLICAGTEMIGIGMLGFARFGKFQQAGYAIPLGLAATLLASLTLTFALLRLIGRWGFWPRRLVPSSKKRQQHQDATRTERFWHTVGRIIQRSPGRCLTAGILLFTPLIAVTAYNRGNITYDIVSDMPEDAPSLRGARVLQNYFAPGVIGPMTVLLENPDVDFDSPQAVAWSETIHRRLLARRDELNIADIRGLADPMGSSPRLKKVLRTVSAWTEDYVDVLPGEAELIAGHHRDPMPAALIEAVVTQASSAHYISRAGENRGTVMRMEVVLDSEPFVRDSIDRVPRLRDAVLEALPTPLRGGTRVLLMGGTAGLYDISVVADSDLSRIHFLASAAVLILLLIMLRKVALSCYLIASIIFTYASALGATYLTFQWLLGDAFVGLEWTVPILLFTLLMAVGADYNVMLISRVQEEDASGAGDQAIPNALAATGGLISGAGLVMAGTFSALIWGGKLNGMQQLGFALSCGVMIDTFFVRPVMLPAFLVLQRKFSRRFKKKPVR